MVLTSSNLPYNETKIRRRMASIYNKQEAEFPSLRQFHGYLEEAEGIINNLIEGNNVPAIEAKIARYEEENGERIMISNASKAKMFDVALAASNARLGANHIHAENYYARTGRILPPLVGHGAGYEEMMEIRAERGGMAEGWSEEISRKREFEQAFSTNWI